MQMKWFSGIMPKFEQENAQGIIQNGLGISQPFNGLNFRQNIPEILESRTRKSETSENDPQTSNLGHSQIFFSDLPGNFISQGLLPTPLMYHYPNGIFNPSEGNNLFFSSNPISHAESRIQQTSLKLLQINLEFTKYFQSMQNNTLLADTNERAINNDLPKHNDTNERKSAMVSFFTQLNDQEKKIAELQKVEQSNGDIICENAKKSKNGMYKVKRMSKQITKCPHSNAKHYAKNMCSNCYHSKGRMKRPWNCPHKSKSHYALGLCQNCYQSNYTKQKKSVDEISSPDLSTQEQKNLEI